MTDPNRDNFNKEWGDDDTLFEVHDPDLPFFEILVGGEKAAELFEPAYAEMFWCSYRIVPVDQEWDDRLRETWIWDECKFEVRKIGDETPEPIALAGGYTFNRFCRREGDRIDFRSLWPPEERIVTPKSFLWSWLRKWSRDS